MFCPKCGNEMVVRPHGYVPDDIHECVTGNMSLSPRLDKKLMAKIEEMPFEPVEDESLVETSKPWYCPRCGKRMLTHDPRSLEKVCVYCGLTLEKGIIYELVEIHPHKNSEGG